MRKHYAIDSGNCAMYAYGENEEEALMDALERMARGGGTVGMAPYIRVAELATEPHYFETDHWIGKVGGERIEDS